MYSLRPTMPSGTLYSSVIVEGLTLQTSKKRKKKYNVVVFCDNHKQQKC